MYEKGEEITRFKSLTFGSVIHNEKGEFSVFTHEGVASAVSYNPTSPIKHLGPSYKTERKEITKHTWYYSGYNLGEFLRTLTFKYNER